MNRIQQILSKAERDGTTRRLASVDEMARVPGPEAMHAASRARSAVTDARTAVTDERGDGRDGRDVRQDDTVEPVSYDSPSVATHMSVGATLDPLLVAALDPFSPAAEQYRSLRGRIAQAENGQAMRVLQITSPAKGDGKTMTALNLALTMAREFQRRVLIIDADLRHPRVHEFLGLEPGPGLVDVLTGSATLEDALVEIPEHHLTVLRAGRAYERPAEMLGSGPMRRLIDTLRTQFDRIVVDSAPATVADPGAIAPLADGLLMVVRASTTQKPAIASALSTMASSKLLGLVFNESTAPVQGQYGAGA